MPPETSESASPHAPPSVTLEKTARTAASRRDRGVAAGEGEGEFIPVLEKLSEDINVLEDKIEGVDADATTSEKGSNEFDELDIPSDNEATELEAELDEMDGEDSEM